MQKFGEATFRKDRVKIQIWGKPVIFSHELCLYITRFWGLGTRLARDTRIGMLSRVNHVTSALRIESVNKPFRRVRRARAKNLVWGYNSLVPTPRALPGEKWSGERSRISWAYSPKRWKTNELARSVIVT